MEIVPTIGCSIRARDANQTIILLSDELQKTRLGTAQLTQSWRKSPISSVKRVIVRRDGIDDPHEKYLVLGGTSILIFGINRLSMYKKQNIFRIVSIWNSSSAIPTNPTHNETYDQ